MSRPLKVAIITGGAGGLGVVIAQTLLNDGFGVVLADIDRSRLGVAEAQLDGGDRVLSITTDITDEESIARLIETIRIRWGRVDALINNAGTEPAHTIAELPIDLWDRTFAVNVRGPALLVKHCVPLWSAQQSGTTIFIGSRAWLSGSSTASYVASKAAVVGLMRSVAVELGPLGVTANVVAPSFVRTPFNEQKGDPARVEAYATAFADGAPLRRLIEPQDVADVVSFLASPKARNITGDIVNVTPGAHLPGGPR
jgi:NAD(P)-dependent dehydrogenase (short-subunit alcohol dehydrogenase family)